MKVVEPGLLTKTLETTLNVVRGLELIDICWRNVFIFVVVLVVEHVVEGLQRIWLISVFDVLQLSYLVGEHRVLLDQIILGVQINQRGGSLRSVEVILEKGTSYFTLLWTGSLRDQELGLLLCGFRNLRHESIG